MFASVAYAAVITGTANSDKLVGTNGADTINALGGVDKVSGGGGADIIDGGSETDLLKGEGGARHDHRRRGLRQASTAATAPTRSTPPTARQDVVECGNGGNDVANVDAGDFVDDDCETVNVIV